MKYLRRHSRLVLVALGLLIALTPVDAVGQPPAREGVTDIFLPAPRGLRQQLARATKALEEERFSEAVDLLGQLLADSPAAEPPAGQGEQDYFLSGSEVTGTRLSLKAEAQRLLGSMPDKGRDLYELKFGADARQLLDRAVEAQEFPQLIEVTRRYFHTNAGYEATMLISRHYLDQGRPLAAALRLQRLVSSTTARKLYEPELSVLLATCWLLADMPERARETLVNLKASEPQATLRIGDKDVSLFENEDKALSWLVDVIGAGFTPAGVEATEWVMFRGDAARNAESAGGSPLLTARWRVQTANHPTDEQMIRQRQAQYRDQGIPVLPSLHPLAVSNVILMRSPRMLLAVDIETGKRIWNFPWFDDPDGESLENDRIRPDQRVPNPQTMELNRRVWDDAPYGQMSSDGNQVFLIWGLSSDTQQPLVQIFGGRPRPNAQGASEYNKLVALDLKAQGKLRWIVGDEDGTDEPKLAGAFFLGAPLPLMGQLYALAEVNSEIRLVVLDADTGHLEWSQQLAHVDMRNIAADPIRRSAGASPSFSDGVLVCPTSAGAVVAVDLSTRSLLWGYQYPTSSRPMKPGMGMYPYVTRQVGERWADASVTIAEGRVLLTPVESDLLYCLDLLSGKPVWEPKPRNGLIYTGCVTNGKAVMVGTEELQAIALSDGSVVWTTRIAEGMPSGRGMLAGSGYYLPTTAGHLLKIAVNSGEVIEDIQTEHVLGNLVAYRDQIISQNVDWLSAHYQIEPLRKLVARHLQENPDDSWALARQAELLLAEGKHNEAVAVFRRAFGLNPQDDAVRSSLVRALLTALRDDFKANRQFALELDQLIDRPSQRAELYRLMAVGFEALGELEESVNFFVKLASLDTSSGFGGEAEQNELVRVDTDLRVRRDRWIRGHLGQMYAEATDEARTRIDATVSAHFDAIAKNPSLVGLRRFIDHFGDHPLGARAQLQLARLLLERNHFLDAEQQLIALQETAEPATAATATAVLADLMKNNNKLPEAVLCYERLAGQWADVKTLDGRTGAELVAAARQDEALAAVMTSPADWPYGKCLVNAEAQGTFSGTYLNAFPVELTSVTGPFSTDTSLVYDRQQNAVLFRDGYGRTLQRVLLGEGSRFLPSSASLPAGSAAAQGHLVLLTVGSDVFAIDTLREATGGGDVVLWREDLSSSIIGRTGSPRITATSIARPWGPTLQTITESGRAIGSLGPVTRFGAIYQKTRELVCADPLTGEVLWTRSGIEPGADLFGDDEYLFVVESDADEAIVLRSSDGTELGRRAVATRRDRWMTAGRFVLSCHLEDGKLRVRWSDAWQQQQTWQREFEVKSQCWLPSRDEVAVMEPSGKLTVIRLNDGQTSVEAQLEAEPRLSRLYVIRSRDQYTVAACRQEARRSDMPRTRYFGALESDFSPEVNGRIYAIDRKSGALRWPVPAEVRDFKMPLDQPAESPALVFLNNTSNRTSAATPRTTYKGAALCLDKRDGRKILSDDTLAAIRTFAIDAQPEEHTVAIRTNSKQFVIRFTDEPVEKESPFQMKEPTPETGALEQVGKIAGAILEAIAKPKQRTDEQPKVAPGKKDDAAPEKTEDKKKDE